MEICFRPRNNNQDMTSKRHAKNSIDHDHHQNPLSVCEQNPEACAVSSCRSPAPGFKSSRDWCHVTQLARFFGTTVNCSVLRTRAFPPAGNEMIFLFDAPPSHYCDSQTVPYIVTPLSPARLQRAVTRRQATTGTTCGTLTFRSSAFRLRRIAKREGGTETGRRFGGSGCRRWTSCTRRCVRLRSTTCGLSGEYRGDQGRLVWTWLRFGSGSSLSLFVNTYLCVLL